MSTNSGFSVDPAALVKQAQDWYNRASQMGALAQQVAQANYTVPSYSIFAPAVGVYTQGCERIARLCSEAETQMDRIASALITASGNYGQADGAASSSVRAAGAEIEGFAREIMGSAGAAQPAERNDVNMIDQTINVKR
jgi:hypothetical protein